MKAYQATVVDLVPGVTSGRSMGSLEQIHDCSSFGYGDTIQEAESAAIANSAVNCPLRVYVVRQADQVIVKGPYILAEEVSK